MRIGWCLVRTLTAATVGAPRRPLILNVSNLLFTHQQQRRYLATRSGGARAPRVEQQQHAQSRRAGRAAARASPLSHNLHTSGSSSTPRLSGVASAFGSTQHERHYDPTAQVHPDDPAETQMASTAPVVAPYSALAYRSRLGQGHVHSLLDLAHAPYAPRPLQVLLDVFAVLRATPDGLEGGAETSASLLGLAPLRPEAKKRLQIALSRTPEVTRLLNEVVEEVVEIAKAAETLSDRESLVERQEAVVEVERFVTLLLAARSPSSRSSLSEEASTMTSSSDVMLSSPLEWQLPEPVYVEALHESLRMARHLDMHETALIVLEALLTVDQARREAARVALRHRGEEAGAARREDEEMDDSDDSFALDAVVSVVEMELAQHVRPMTAIDHLLAMESCAAPGAFTVALMLYKRLVQHAQMGYVPVTAADFERALIALAHSVRNAVQFAELQTLLIQSEVAQSVPVTVELYASLIDAVSRAEENPERMSIALALYRRLRDGQLTPSVEAYSALMACCASCQEPTHAFAFYHEARLLCGAAALTPAIYTNLLLSYANAGYGADARKTLEVLVEAGAPLTRASFHAVLSGAMTLREAQEVFDIMVETYHIPPTPHTFAFLIQASVKQPRGVSTALQVFDLHEAALHALVDGMPERAPPATAAASQGDEAVALSTRDDSARLEKMLLEKHPHYVQSLEHALMKLRIDPHLDPRLSAYLKPLVRLAQQHMNIFTGNRPPQAPTFVPPGPQTCIAVLAPDVLADLDTFVEPFMSYYTVVVIPYSALLALSVGSAKRRVEGVSVKGVGAGLHDKAWQAAGSERGALIEHRRRRLERFLDKYRDAIHIVSLEEELTWSRDVGNYGIATKDLHARSAAFAIQLARSDVKRGFRLYAKAASTIVLVSTDYRRCGRYVVDLKQQYNRSGTDGDAFTGLRDGLSRVLFHNPRTQPQWSPPSLSASHLRQVSDDLDENGKDIDRAGGEDAHEGRTGSPYVEAVSEDAAAQLYQRLVHAVDAKKSGEMAQREGERVAPTVPATTAPSANRDSAVPVEAEDLMDAELLLNMMNA